jgi:phage terminase large subunit
VTVPFNWRDPDYISVYQERVRRLNWLREAPDERVPMIMRHYRDHPWALIDDWGMTADPRNADIGLPVVTPFLLFPKQREWCEWVVGQWRARKPGMTPKSRDVGVSWLAVALGAALCLTHEDLVIGYGSRKAELVDKLRSPKSLFWKARRFIELLPREINGGWNRKADSVEMQIIFPMTGSVMGGEAGDGIGRGDRAAIYFVDEAAHIERPALIDASLSQTTNCRIDVSSANGTGNSFYQKVSGGKISVFSIHWRDDPRKDDEWYRKQQDELDPVTLAQEIDINFQASQTGLLIPAPWVNAAVDADKVLRIAPPTGAKRGAMDVADEGKDLNAFCVTDGVVIADVRSWSGKGDDIFGSVQNAFAICDEMGLEEFDFDSDGLGAGVRGDARVINERRKAAGIREIRVTPFRGSGEVFKPDKAIPSATPGTVRERLERTNGDFFMNAKAQAWWELRVRLQRTFRAVTSRLEYERNPQGAWSLPYRPDELIVFRRFPELPKLIQELSQPTYTLSATGKVVVDKTPDDTRSPNLADSVMIRFAPRKLALSYSAVG